jgi:rhomboid protease GluP
MAIDLTSTHTERFSTGNLTEEQRFLIAIEAVKQLGWRLGDIHLNTELIAFTDDEEVNITLNDGTATVKSTSTGSQSSEVDNNRKNTQTFKSIFEQLRGTLSSEDLSLKYKKLLREILIKEWEAIAEHKPTTSKEDIQQFLSFFVPKSGYAITPILLDLNILVFLLMALSGANIWEPDGESLLWWGAIYKPFILAGEWWRLLTACFVHIGFIHLFMNMFALLYIGRILDPLLGKLRFIIAYLFTGLAASVTSLWWHKGISIAAGASGAIFGMYGVFFALLTTNLMGKEERDALLPIIAAMVGYSLLMGLRGNVDNAAHIGGLLSGMLVGYLLYTTLKKREIT